MPISHRDIAYHGAKAQQLATKKGVSYDTPLFFVTWLTLDWQLANWCVFLPLDLTAP